MDNRAKRKAKKRNATLLAESKPERHGIMKSLALLSLLLFTFFQSYSQDSNSIKYRTTTDLSFIDNKKTKHAIVMMACRTCAPISNLGYRVVIELTEKEWNKIKGISPVLWLKLLNNSSTDFSANLILYSLYSKDAFLLSQNNSKELWSKCLKKNDLDFWNAKFKSPKKVLH